MTRFILPFLISSLMISAPGASFAQAKGSVSGLPIPRFVSLKSKRVNMRVGPGRDYKVQWLYVRQGLPVEIIREFDNWRKVRDPSGQEGWILHSLLTGKRTAIIAPWEMKQGRSTVFTARLYDEPSLSARIVANVEAGTMASVIQCQSDFCEIAVKRADSSVLEGYIEQTAIWGVYPGEAYEAD